jgi:galactokinase
LDVYFTSTLPTGAGLSSSAAIQVLMGYIVHHFATGRVNRPSLALLAQRAENQFIGVACGIMDPFAVAMAQAGRALLLHCAALTHEHVPFAPRQHQLWVLHTGVSRALVEGEYNSRRIACERAFRRLSQRFALPHLAAATLPQLEQAGLEGEDLRLARHVVTEQARVKAAAHALRLTDWAQFGALLNASHASLRDDFQVTGPALDAIVAAAQAHPACLGARMTGAGFAGSAIALVEASGAEAFAQEVAQAYAAQTGHTPNLFAVESAGAVGPVG